MLKIFRFGELAGKNQRVNAGFIDKDSPCTIDGERIVHRLIFRVYVVMNGLLGVLVPKRRRNVFPDEPRFTIDIHNPDFAELLTVKGLQIAHFFTAPLTLPEAYT